MVAQIYMIEISLFKYTGCTNDEIRLVPGITRSNSLPRNYVQYCVNGKWTSLCTRANRWRSEEAQVTCRQLGYSDQGV